MLPHVIQCFRSSAAVLSRVFHGHHARQRRPYYRGVRSSARCRQPKHGRSHLSLQYPMLPRHSALRSDRPYSSLAASLAPRQNAKIANREHPTGFWFSRTGVRVFHRILDICRLLHKIGQSNWARDQRRTPDRGPRGTETCKRRDRGAHPDCGEGV